MRFIHKIGDKPAGFSGGTDSFCIFSRKIPGSTAEAFADYLMAVDGVSTQPLLVRDETEHPSFTLENSNNKKRMYAITPTPTEHHSGILDVLCSSTRGPLLCMNWGYRDDCSTPVLRGLVSMGVPREPVRFYGELTGPGRGLGGKIYLSKVEDCSYPQQLGGRCERRSSFCYRGCQ